MLGIGKGKLLRDGERTQGVVTARDLILLEGGNWSNMYRVTVRVTFPDGLVTERYAKLDAYRVGMHREAAIVPVRYDVDDRSKVEIDVPQMEADHAGAVAAETAERERREAAEIARAEQQIATGRSAADTPASESAAGLDVANTVASMTRMTATAGAFSDTVAAIRRARAAGDDAEVERLKALFKQRGPQG